MFSNPIILAVDIVRKNSWGKFLSLLEEENGQENQKPFACFVIDINEIDNFTIA